MSNEKDITAVRRRLTSFVAEASKNETILRRAQERELMLLRSESLEQLFENMVAGLQASYGLEAVTVAIADPQHEIHHLLLFARQNGGPPPGTMLVDDLTTLSPCYATLNNVHLATYDKNLHSNLFEPGERVRSVALLPLLQRSKTVGCINFGSSDPQRFTSHHATDFLDHLGAIAGFCLENATNRARLVWSGLTDVLTGWHNRRYLNSRLPEEVARAQRLRNSLSCILFDLDFFKKVNDTYGHLAGDAALREVARRVQKQIRASDVAARYGGEEFVVLMPDTDAQHALILAERIRQSVCGRPVRLSDHDAITITVSVGVASCVEHDEAPDLRMTGEKLLTAADKALYRAKNGGRNRVEVAGSDSGSCC